MFHLPKSLYTISEGNTTDSQHFCIIDIDINNNNNHKRRRSTATTTTRNSSCHDIVLAALDIMATGITNVVVHDNVNSPRESRWNAGEGSSNSNSNHKDSILTMPHSSSSVTSPSSSIIAASTTRNNHHINTRVLSSSSSSSSSTSSSAGSGGGGGGGGGGDRPPTRPVRSNKTATE